VVDGVRETWELRWQGEPALFCTRDDAFTCPCTAFGIGEIGDLRLVRRRGGRVIETMALGPLFFTVEHDGKARLQRWRHRDGDEDVADLDARKAFAKRPVTHPLVFRDLDHDGRATEFVLPVLGGVCGHVDEIAIGLDAATHLHALGTAEAPNVPAILPRIVWDALAKRASVDVVTMPFGDHGAEVEVTTHVRAKRGRLRVWQTTRGAPADPPY
jgi:hypothetical protein